MSPSFEGYGVVFHEAVVVGDEESFFGSASRSRASTSLKMSVGRTGARLTRLMSGSVGASEEEHPPAAAEPHPNQNSPLCRDPPDTHCSRIEGGRCGGGRRTPPSGGGR